MLQSFIASMLDIPIESISEINITNPEIPPESISGKFSRLDLNMKVDNRLVNVEIQVKNDNDYRDRVLFYWAKLYTSELKSGEKYGVLKQTISINIINFNMFDGDNYHNEVNAVVKQTGEEDFEMISQTNIPIMQKAVRVIYDMSEDTKIREAARMREKALHDEASALHNAEQKGKSEGRAEERDNIIKKMLAAGMTDEQIQAILGK